MGYKFVSTGIGSMVADGSIRLGTTARYARMEGERVDPFDSATSVVCDIPVIYRGPEDKDAVVQAARLGIEIDQGARNVRIEGFTAVSSGPPMLILCLCWNSENCFGDPEGLQDMVKVKNVPGLAWALKKARPDLLGSCWIDFVRYGAIETSVTMEPIDPDVFLKAEKWRGEEEIRLAFALKSALPTGITHIDIDIGYRPDLLKLVRGFRPRPVSALLR